MKAVLNAVLCAAALIGATAPAAAQGANLQLVPRVGVSMPLGTLADNTEIAIGLAYGAAAELVLPGLPFNVRATLDYARAADIVERSPAEPVLGSATILAIVGDVVLRPLPATALAQPFFLGGAGVKTYDLDIAAGAGADLLAMAGRTARFTVHVGGGLDFSLGPLSLVLEVSDYISTLPDRTGESRLQNDVFGTLGFRVAMF